MTSTDAPTGALDADAEARFEEVVARVRHREDERAASRAMWLAHHWPDQYDRCISVGGRPVCRRCATLYPISLTVAVLGVAGLSVWPASIDTLLIWLLCLPATAEFVLEQLGRVAYSARRQVLVTALLAPALGRGFAHQLTDGGSWLFWGPVLVFCTIWFVAALAGRRRSMARHG